MAAATVLYDRSVHLPTGSDRSEQYLPRRLAVVTCLPPPTAGSGIGGLFFSLDNLPLPLVS
jgi:hypothetical protein